MKIVRVRKKEPRRDESARDACHWPRALHARGPAGVGARRRRAAAGAAGRRARGARGPGRPRLGGSRRGAGGGRAQPLFAPPALPDRALPRGLHRRDRDRRERGLCLQGPRPAAPGRGEQQPGGRGADRRYRQARHLRRQGPAGAGGVRAAERGRPRPPARSRRALVRALEAGAGDRGLEGARARRRHRPL